MGGSALGVALALFCGVLSGGAYCCVRALLRKGETELWVVLAFPLVSAPVGVMDALKHILGEGLETSLLCWILALGVFTQGGADLSCTWAAVVASGHWHTHHVSGECHQRRARRAHGGRGARVERLGRWGYHLCFTPARRGGPSANQEDDMIC